MNKLLFEVANESEIFRLYEIEEYYTGILTKYETREIVATETYFYDKANLPEALLILLIEANDNLTYQQQQLLWSLVDDDYLC